MLFLRTFYLFLWQQRILPTFLCLGLWIMYEQIKNIAKLQRLFFFVCVLFHYILFFIFYINFICSCIFSVFLFVQTELLTDFNRLKSVVLFYVKNIPINEINHCYSHYIVLWIRIVEDSFFFTTMFIYWKKGYFLKGL